MSRFAPGQPDLFAPPAPVPAVPERPPLEQLTELLAMLRAADRPPWPTIMAAMHEEHRVAWLGRQAGDEGAKLVAAIADETERLFVAEEQEAANGAVAE